jgi:hypothetical protein
MTVEFDRNKLLNMVEKSRKKLLTMVGEQGASLAAMNTHPHFDTGASTNAKQYTFTDPNQITPFKNKSDVKKVTGSADDKTDTVYIIAPMEYDVYLERFGIMARTNHQLRPFIKKFTESIFG